MLTGRSIKSRLIEHFQGRMEPPGSDQRGHGQHTLRERPHDDPADRFRNLIECLALYVANHRKSAAMDAEIRALSPAARKLYSTQRRQVEQMLANTIEQGVAAGVFEVTSPGTRLACATTRRLLGRRA